MLIATLFLAAALDPVFDSPAGLMCSRYLMWSNRFGSFDRVERAAFIIDRGDGEIRCVMWPDADQHERASFRGSIPPGTIAIIHSHPLNVPWPSNQDIREARRLGIAIYALTPTSVTKALPSNDPPARVRNGFWLDPVPKGHPCSRMIANAAP
ncbi:MAG TPA: Mov34/MPN/PAD-1 family protein [Thermoanaerobaculia bacterium]|nr:Mov34/MPN/PAD-1 family protein [Thermoanaerobaculia bacterium]